MANIKEYWQNYIDGEWVDGGAGRIDVLDPATGAVLATHALADARDVDGAVQAAKRVHASGALRDMRPIERGRLVQGFWVGRRCDRCQDTLYDEPVDDRRFGQDGRMGNPLPWRDQQRCHPRRNPCNHPRQRHLLRCPSGAGMLSCRA